MDWTTPLRSQQADFIERLKLGHLLSVPTEGLHSEAIALSGATLERLQRSCWLAVERARVDFRETLGRAIAHAALAARLGDFIREVTLEPLDKLRVDFTLAANPAAGIRLQICQGSEDAAQWSIDAEEVEQNSVLVCVLVQPEVRDRREQYRLIFAGFLPTKMIQLRDRSTSFAMDNLLYIGGLQSYLESLNIDVREEKIELADTSSLSNWLPVLTSEELELKSQQEWKQGFIRWIQDLALHAPTHKIKLYLYDLLNTQYYRQTLWKLYRDREFALEQAITAEEVARIIERTNAKTEDVMFELAGLSKNDTDPEEPISSSLPKS